ncbi:MAG: HYR domain-containing protein [Bacteroidia bacterium]|nr:HYR domain-containing protein [Bacteroidia bacterium]
MLSMQRSTGLVRRMLVSLPFLLLILPGLFAQPALGGTEIQVNSTSNLSQQFPAAAMDTLGNYVVVWESEGTDGDDYGIYFQRFSSGGAPQGTETRVNSTISGGQRRPDIAMDAAGNFVIVWMSDGEDGDKYGIYGQRYNSSGATQGSNFQINVTTAGNQKQPRVGMSDGGDFVVTWMDESADGSGFGVYFRIYNSGGAPLITETLVNSGYTTDYQGYPEIAVNGSGDFVIAWQSLYQDGDRQGVYFQRYNAAGTAQGSATLANTTTADNQQEPGVGMDENGNFIIVWASANAQDGDAEGIYGRLFDSSGNPQGSEFLVNTTTSGSQDHPQAIASREGLFAVVWESYGQDGSYTGVYLQEFNTDGTPLGTETQVNTRTTDFQHHGALAWERTQDSLIVAWMDGLYSSSSTHDGSNYGVYSRGLNMFSAVAAVCQDITVYLDGSGSASILGSEVDGGSTGAGSFSVNPSSFNCTNTGAHAVTLIVGGIFSGADTCTAQVTVLDTTSPTASCQDISVNLDAGGSASITTGQVDAGSSDNCSIAAYSLSQSSFTCSSTGNNAVTLTLTDPSGNSSQCVANVTVIDNIDPTITCPANITVSNTSGVCGAQVNFVVTTSDNCTGEVLTQTGGLGVGSTFPVGTSSSSWLVTDPSGNEATCSFTITVTDNENPVITCPADLTVSNDAGNCSAVVNYAVSTSDNCTGKTLSQNTGQSSGSAFAIGSTTNSFTVTDASGNTASCSFTVTVNDTESPTLSCPSAISVSNDAGNCSAVVTYSVTASDNCTGYSLSQTAGQASGTTFALGSTSNSFTVTDASGNSTSCSFTVTVTDNENPVISCPANITTSNDAGNCSALITYSVTGSDNCPGFSLVQTAGQASGTDFAVGSTTNTFVITDGSNNTATCSFIVTVNDTQLPVISCPGNVAVSNDAGLCAAVVSYTVTSSDNCAGSSLSQASGLASGSAFPVGSTNNAFTVTDASGNTASCSFTVTVSDNENPVIACPANQTVFNDAGNCSAVVNYSVSTSDNCSGEILTQSTGQSSGSAFSIGSTTNSFTVTDASGNTASCSFTVTVNDTESPTLSCPSAISVSNDAGNCSAVVTYSVTASDNCPLYNLSQTAGQASGTTFAVGSTTNSFNVTDASGNAATCSFIVTVTDNESPVISCPANITASNDAGDCSAVITYAVTGSDNCTGSSLVQTAGQASGTDFAVGSTTNTFVITDGNGNSATCNFSVTVNDTEPPVINCPADLTVSNDPGSCDAVVNYTPPTTSDNCGWPSGYLQYNGHYYLYVQTNMRWTNASTAAENAGGYLVSIGNSAENSFIQSIISSSVWIGANDTAVEGTFVWTNGDPLVYTSWAAGEPNNNLGDEHYTEFRTDGTWNDLYIGAQRHYVIEFDSNPLLNQTAGLGTGATFPLGTTTETWNVTDAGGNTVSCSFDITVEDTEAPEITCPGDITVSNDPGLCEATVNYSTPTATDNCASTFTSGNVYDGHVYVLVTSKANWINAAIAAANMGGHLATISSAGENAFLYNLITENTWIGFNDTAVEGTFVWVNGEPVVYTNWSAGEPNNNLGDEHYTEMRIQDGKWNDAYIGTKRQYLVEFDNLASLSLTSGLGSGATFPVGVHTETWTAWDGNGNSADCSFDITVEDTEAPLALCQDVTLQLDATGNATLSTSQVDAGSTDNCGLGSLSLSQSAFSCQDALTLPVLTNTFGAAGRTVTYNSVVINGQNTRTLAVSGGTAVSLTLNWTNTYTGTFCPGCIQQYYLGLAGDGVNESCLRSGSTNFTFTQSNTINFTAPTTPGVYVVQMGSSLQFSCVTRNYGAADLCGNVNGMVALIIVGNGIPSTTLTVTDVNGNSSSCTANVTVEDVTPPTAVCQDITLQLDATGQVSLTGNDLDGGSTDACGIASLNASTSAFDCFQLGVNTVTLTVEDVHCNASTCTSQVTVEDQIAPVALCQDITVQLDVNNSATLNATDVDGGSTDNCEIILSIPSTSYDCDDLGPQSVVLTVTDSSGNSSSCTAQVEVRDDNFPCNQPPVAVCQNATLYVDGSCTATILATDIDGGSYDPDNDPLVYVVSPAGPFGVGTYSTTLTVTDPLGANSSCSATVTINDSTPPQALCNDLTVQLNASGTGSLTVNDVNNGSSDNCGIASLSLSQSSFACGDVGLNQITLNLTDVNGNASSCTSNVTVQDNLPPVALCQDVTLSLDLNGAGSVTASAVDDGSTDNCGIASKVLDLTSFGCGDVGVNLVELTVTDVNGNASACTANVTVEDLVAPVALCQDITVQLDNNGNGSTTAAAVNNGSNDACGIASLSLDITAFNCSNVGSNPVVLTVTDNNGNSSSCAANVEVVDQVPPLALCQDITVNLDASGNVSIAGGQVDGGSTDNCTIQFITVSPPNTFDCSHVGPNVVTLAVVDVNNNYSICTANVTIQDITPPIALCQDVTVQLDASGSGAATANAVDNGSNDACGIQSLALSATSFNCGDVGANPVTLTVTDNNGNISTCSAIVQVEDNVAPVALCQDVTVQLDASGNGSTTAVAVDNGSNDACGIQSLALSATSFNCGNVGANPVTLTVTDNNGNISTCSANIQVEDNVAPVALCQDVTVQLDASGNGSTSAQAVDNGSNDACGIASLSLSQTSFNCGNVGANPVTLTVTDVNGNVSTCSASVEVEDNVPPIALCQDLTINTDSTGFVAITPQQIDNGSSDNCTVASLAVNPNTFDCNDKGQNPVVLTVMDVNGNVSTCNATVTVTNDPLVCSTSSPTFACGYNISCNGQTDGQATVSVTGGCLPYSYLWSDGQLTSTAINLAAGTYSVTVTDGVGDQTTCTITLTEPAQLVDGFSIPTFACGYNVSCNGASDGLIDYSLSGGCQPYTYSWTGPNGYTFSGQDPQNITAGTYNVTATDQNGCFVTNSFTLTQPAPLAGSTVIPTYACGYNISCNGNSDGSIDYSMTGGCQPYSYSWSGPNGFTATSQDISNLVAGTYNVTTTDANGCSLTESFTLTQPAVMQITSLVPSVFAGGYNIGCNGGANGKITVNIAGGASCQAYTVTLSGPVSGTQTGGTPRIFTGLTAGTYTVTVTDANGCTDVSTITLTQAPPLSVDAGVDRLVILNTPFLCPTITAIPTGGVAPYSYYWFRLPSPLPFLNGQTMIDCPTTTTTYVVRIKDANSCVAFDTVVVNVIQRNAVGNPDCDTLGYKFCFYESCTDTCIRTGNLIDTLASYTILGNCLGDCENCGPCAGNMGSKFAQGQNNLGDSPLSSDLMTDGAQFQAYPNPFEEKTTLRFSLPEDQQVTIVVYDLRGELVSTLFEGSVKAHEEYEVAFQPEKVTDGVYITKLMTNTGAVYYRKLILLR